MNRKLKLYLECSAGISGDMTAAALLDLGADRIALEKALDSLNISGYRTEIKRVSKAGTDACDFSVILESGYENRDHDMEYLHGHDSHGSEHSHEHDGHGSGHHHEHRHLSDIINIIDSADMSENAAVTAKKIFRILAEAEAKAHGSTPEQVHFHEAGAVDSIVDVVAAAVCLDSLHADEVIVSELCEGKGSVRCQHGIMPVPVPAVVNIISNSGLKLRITDVQGEFVTPTGAAIAAAVRTSDRLPESFRIIKIGTGAGKREYEKPSILRAMLIEDTSGTSADHAQKDAADDTDEIIKLECDIDDCTGEVFGYVMDRLFEEGARDVHYFPVFMKKNRPAYQLNVICGSEDVRKLSDIIFSETTTIGIRIQKMSRRVLSRNTAETETEFGKIKVKICESPGGVRIYPEYDSVAAAAAKSGKSFAEVFRTAEAQARGDIL